jgi:tetratricopeptide (TPR) repeat protein
MSLLIKALDKAQNAKTEQAQAEIENIKAEPSVAKQKQTEKGKANVDLELSLSPAGSSLAEPSNIAASATSSVKKQNSSSSTASPTSNAPASSNLSSKNAANVFSAKGLAEKNDNNRLALIAGAGLLALLAMGAYFYRFIDNTPDIVIPQRPIALHPAPQVQQTVNNTNPTTPIQAAVAQKTEHEVPPAPASDEAIQLTEERENTAKIMPKKKTIAVDEEVAVAENPVEASEPSDSTKLSKKTGKSKTLQFGETIASPSVSISVTKTKPQPSVNPTLMSAYEAYNAGNDSDAQKLYKQVLQQDVRNVDALLGMGAIASRQGRTADANGWYGKVLEVEPRNNLAQTALLENQQQDDSSQGNAQISESRLKNMLAKRPDDASLHAALGNLYAEQNQWPAAQQAYFEAYSLNSSADNAFNLAVSLDQLGKPKLALPYYQLALQQASSTSSIDKAALAARIAAIQ